ncbi:hypothetical protein PGAL8A_00475900 [Plasmodium gallinaceum]|uniref:Early transcribed membrane protein n=1 Tax=Plasmodium gallinaceum TaxID=5849 RepID=A0A1J1GXJ5_PLAGA|nr:hypothetical protein PGAL8A_00475900 [Plasmodium gallinaceum]CRG97180.1 hypothetical protein PGAL8A_00475900 [Plasmodium gallinaceum]
MRYLIIFFFYVLLIFILLGFNLSFASFISFQNLSSLKELDSKLENYKKKKKLLLSFTDIALAFSLGTLISGLLYLTLRFSNKKKKSLNKISTRNILKWLTNEGYKGNDTYENDTYENDTYEDETYENEINDNEINDNEENIRHSMLIGDSDTCEKKSHDESKPCYISCCEILKFRDISLGNIKIDPTESKTDEK